VTEQATEPRKKKPRSPSYPGIALQEAIEKARTLYKAEGRHAPPVSAILDLWGYKPKSGGGLVALAALKKFGLVEDEGAGADRRAKLSEQGFAIVVDERAESPDRENLIREAALKPAIHAELWQKYNGSLPSDATMAYELKRDRGFTESGAREFIQQFKETVAFARLAESGSMSDHGEGPPPTPGEDMTMRQESGVTDPGKPDDQGMRVVPVPIGGASWPVLTLPYPMSEEDWRKMLAYLELMKSAFVQESAEGPSEPNGQP
jgi:hypothetical protein